MKLKADCSGNSVLSESVGKGQEMPVIISLFVFFPKCFLPSLYVHIQAKESPYILSPLLRAIFLKPSRAEESVDGSCSPDFSPGCKVVLLEIPADPQEGNAESIPP